MLVGAITGARLVLSVSPLSALILATALLAVVTIGAQAAVRWWKGARAELAPHLGRGLHDELELGFLVIDGQRVALHGRGEATLAG